MFDILGFHSKSFSCHRTTHGRPHFFQVEGLGEIGKRAFPQRSDLIFFCRLGGDDDDRKLRIQLGQHLQHGKAIDVRQSDVEKDGAIMPMADFLDRLPAGADRLGCISFKHQTIA